jgi:hypothetical protein
MAFSVRASSQKQGVATCSEGGAMAKRHGRPSVQYRYEHYDPRV